MKSKQLANVLIKVIGLYVCLSSIPGCVSGVLIALTQLGSPKSDTADMAMRMVAYSVGDVVQVVVGVILIIKSRELAEFWFKGDDE
jgi:hypothetical protein